MMQNMDIYELVYNLKADARDAGIKMHEVCKEAEVHRSTISYWENRKVEPRLSTINKLRTALDRLIKKKINEVKENGHA
jgi:transcriptional regulator with XRE-family HTH domain